MERGLNAPDCQEAKDGTSKVNIAAPVEDCCRSAPGEGLHKAMSECRCSQIHLLECPSLRMQVFGVAEILWQVRDSAGHLHERCGQMDCKVTRTCKCLSTVTVPCSLGCQMACLLCASPLVAARIAV